MILPIKGRPLAAAVRKRAGFTLIELLMVMVVVIIMLSVVAPRLTGSFGLTALKASSAKLASLINYSRYYAIKEGVKCRLYYDLKGASYWLAAAEEDAGNDVKYTRLNTPLGKSQNLPEQISFKQVESSKLSDKAKDDIRWTTFYPDGRADESRIFMTSKDGDIFTIIIFSRTGQVKVLNYEFEGFEK